MNVPWVMRMRWRDLLFAHWPVEVDAIRALVPSPLEIDLFEGRAWLGIVPFRMEDVAPRGIPATPGLSAFPELNVRTYVRHRGRPAVWFLSLDADSRPMVAGARRFFHLPYLLAAMSVSAEGDWVAYRSSRVDGRGRPAVFEGRYRPTGPVEAARPGTLAAWLTDRSWVFSMARDGRLLGTRVQHQAWPLQPAIADIQANSMAASHGLTLPDVPPHLRFARRLDVVAWWPRAA